MKKIVINLLAIGLIGASIVACNSGSSSSGPVGPAAPAVAPITKPDGFVIPTGSTSGAAYNVGLPGTAAQISLPIYSGYTTVTLPAGPGSISEALQTANTAGTLGQVTTTVSNNILVMTIPGVGSLPTIIYTVAGAVPAPQSVSLQSTATAESYTVTAGDMPITNAIYVPAAGVNPDQVIYGTKNNLKVVPANNTSGAEVSPLPISTLCGATGNVTTLSSANVGSVNYLSFGTTQGSVCTGSSADLKFTNLSNQAPTGKYTPDNVNSFGFPASLNTGNTLVGYWNVGTVNSNVNIYRVTGTYVNGAPTGNGFLNTTQAGQQTTTNGTTVVTFTGFPTNASINSSYTDSVGNLWVGTNAGSVYVLRSGATQWTNVALTGATGAVTVETNGATSGATATSLTGTGPQSFAVN